MRKRGFFQDTNDLAMVIKPVKETIVSLKRQNANIADCFFGLARLGAAIKKIPEEDHKMFRRHCIQVFNTRFEEFDFDEHLLAYFLHPEYRGKY